MHRHTLVSGTALPPGRLEALLKAAWSTRLAQPQVSLAMADDALTLAETMAEPVALARAHMAEAMANFYLGSYESSLEHAMIALDQFRGAGDAGGEASALNWMGNIHRQLGEAEQALAPYEAALALHRERGDQGGAAYVLGNLGLALSRLGRFDTAEAHCRESLQIRQDLGDLQGLAIAWSDLGTVVCQSGHQAESVDCFHRSLALAKQSGDLYVEAVTGLSLAEVELSRGQPETALHVAEPALARLLELGALGEACRAYDILSRIWEAHGNPVAALNALRRHGDLRATVMHQGAAQMALGIERRTQLERSRQQEEIYRLRNVELVQANAVKDRFLAIAAHDLRSPLQAIKGFAEMIGWQKDVAAAAIMAGKITTAADRMVRLVSGLLDRAALEAGRLVLCVGPCDFSAQVADAVEAGGYQAQKKGQSIEAMLEPTPPALLDADRVRDCLDNLLNNAVKYSPRNSLIRVFCEPFQMEGAAWLRCAIVDQGPGLTAEDLGQMFQAFTCLSARPTGGEASHGMGLSIVRQLAERHGGHVRAESAGPGQGSTFFLELPASVPKREE